MRPGILLALLLAASAPPAAAEDAFVRCDRGAALKDIGEQGSRSLDANGLYLDESRLRVPGSHYQMVYLYFAAAADPASVMAVYTQFKKHPAAFRDAVSQARVTSRAKTTMKVFFEETVPFFFIPKPRFTLTEQLSKLDGGGYLLEQSLDSAEENSSKPLWFDSFLSVGPYKGKSLVVYCKYVVPNDKRMPSTANGIVRGRALALPRALGDWLQTELAEAAGMVRLRALLDAKFDPSKPDEPVDPAP